MPRYDAITEYERARSRRPGAPAPLARDEVRDLPGDFVPARPVAPVRYLSLEDAYEVPAEDPSPLDFPSYRRSSREVPTVDPSPLDFPAYRPSSLDEAAAAVPSASEVEPELPSAVDVPAARPRRELPRVLRDTGERDRRSELGEQDGWAWLRPFRSYDEYEETLLRALQEIDTHERDLEESRVR